MKKLLLVSTLICAPAVMAHNDNDSTVSFNNEQCNVEFKNDVRIKPDELEIFTANKQTMQFKKLLMLLILMASIISHR
mgnify:CR=1 FL=1